MTEQAVLNKLNEGESLLWLGRPTQTSVFFRFDLNCMLGGALIVLYAVLGFSNLTKGLVNKWVMAIFAVIFCVLFSFGMYCLLTRLLVKAFFRSRVFYAVTNERVMILRRTKSDFINKNDIARIGVVPNRNTIGSVIFYTYKDKKLKGFRAYNILSRMLAPYSTKNFLEVNDAEQLSVILAQNNYGI